MPKVALVSCGTIRPVKFREMVESARGSYSGLDIHLVMQGMKEKEAFLKAGGETTWIQLEVGIGTPKGLNRAIRSALKADAELVVICHPDVEFKGQAIERMVETWQKADKPGLVGPLTNNARSKIGQTAHDPAFREDAVDGVSHLDGFCYMTSREVLAKAGMFDERFPPYFGYDIDFCIRVKLAGYRLYLDRDAYVSHIRWDTGTDYAQEEANGRKLLEDKYTTDNMGFLVGDKVISEENRKRATEDMAKVGKLDDYSGFEHYAGKT